MFSGCSLRQGGREKSAADAPSGEGALVLACGQQQAAWDEFAHGKRQETPQAVPASITARSPKFMALPLSLPELEEEDEGIADFLWAVQKQSAALSETARPARRLWTPRARNEVSEIPVSAKKTLLLCKPLPCSPAAEIAIQPLVWSFESRFSHLSSYPADCFCSQTSAGDLANSARASQLVPDLLERAAPGLRSSAAPLFPPAGRPLSHSHSGKAELGLNPRLTSRT